MAEIPEDKPIEKHSFLYFVRHIGVQILLFTFIVSLIYLLKNPSIVDLTFTNIGFAIFLALANTCFSWARSLTEVEDKETASTINGTAMYCIFCALTFVFSSIMQLVINSIEARPLDMLGVDYFVYLLKIIRFLLVTLVLALGFGIIIQLVVIIFKKFKTDIIDNKDKQVPSK